MEAHILLEDGTILNGKAFGSCETVIGEIVFNTGMTGYEEVLTDPSYGGQIVTMTYPLVGNYGINHEDVQSDQIQVTGFVVKEWSKYPNHWQCQQTLDDYLKEHHISGIYGVDTRLLTKKIRNYGTMKCMITTEVVSDQLFDQVKSYTFPKDIVSKVSTQHIKKIDSKGLTIGIVDLGIKKGILDQLKRLSCSLVVFPYDTTPEDILAYPCDAVLFSNGPGDPKDVDSAIHTAKTLMGQVPLRGICLGHQILALALGADTYKLKFGHRGSNHPVLELETNKVLITSQNHGYAVRDDSLTDDMEATYTNINDQTNEGFRCVKYQLETVQFHPEEGPGPEDTHYIFDKWIKQLITNKTHQLEV